jgi:DNA-binding NarL/FixJ family response regulator
VVKHSASEELFAALRGALAGKSFVSPTIMQRLASLPVAEQAGLAARAPGQCEVSRLYADDRTSAETASNLGMSAPMVENGKSRVPAPLDAATVDDLRECAGSETPLADRSSLTAREKEILEHLLAGKTLKQIASTCMFSIQTAWKHQQKIFSKFQVENEVQLVRMLLSGKTDSREE